MQTQPPIHEATPSNSNHHRFTVDQGTKTYVDSATECIDIRVKDAESEIAQVIRIIRRLSDEVTVSHHEEEFAQNLTKATLALAAALGHVLEIGEVTSEMNEWIGEDGVANLRCNRRKRSLTKCGAGCVC